MNIVMYTQEDPFYVIHFFNEFLNNYKNLSEIKAIVISKAMGKKSIFKLMKQMYFFYGPFNFVKFGMKYVQYKILGKIKINSTLGKLLLKKSYTISQLVESRKIKCIHCNDINSEHFIEKIRKLNPDLFISIASPIIFKEALINVPKIDCINIHNAPLPKYRGMLPNFWQLYHGEKSVGATVHKIEKGIDTGSIIMQKKSNVLKNETLNELIIRTKKENAIMIMEVIDLYQKKVVNYTPMPENGSYFSFPKKIDVKRFKKMGKKII